LIEADLAAVQSALVRALVHGGPPPAGLDVRRVAASRCQLLDKRARTMAANWPDLAAGFDVAWRDAVGSWAAGRPPAGPTMDGYLLDRDVLAGLLPVTPGPAREAALDVVAGWRMVGTRVVRRRGPAAVRRWAVRRRT
jgi:hypothetical protein